MTFNDINQFNVIDNQALMFLVGYSGEWPIPARHTYITLFSDLESTHIFTLETMFGCTYLQDFIFFLLCPCWRGIAHMLV